MADSFIERLQKLLSSLLPDETVGPGIFNEARLQRMLPVTDPTPRELLGPGPGSRLRPSPLTSRPQARQRMLDIGIIEDADFDFTSRIKKLQEQTGTSREKLRKIEEQRNRELLRQGALPENIPPVSEPFQPANLFPGKESVDAFLRSVDEEEDDEDLF